MAGGFRRWGQDDHETRIGDLEAKDAGDVSVTTTSFGKNLSGSDDTVQKALDTLDDLATGGSPDAGDVGVTTTGFDGILSGSDDDVQAALDTIDDHTHTQLHDRSHAVTSTDDHTAGNWKVLYTNGSGAVTELALGASGTMLQSAGASSAPSFAAPNSALGTLPYHRGYGGTLNRLYGIMTNAYTDLTTTGWTANTHRAIPVLIARACTIDQLVLEITSAYTGNVRMGLYADSGNIAPGALVVDGGEKALSSATGVQTWSISQALTPGMYWITQVNSATMTTRSHNTTGHMGLLGYEATLGTIREAAWVYNSLTYGALPDPFGAVTAYQEGVGVPGLFFRIGSYS